MKVTAVTTRSGDWWAVRVPEVDGVFTQAKRLDQVPEMVADAVALMEDVDADSVEVHIEVELEGALGTHLKAVRELREQVERERAKLQDELRSMATQLTQSGFTLRDSGVLLNVSYQRVGQLVDAPVGTKGPIYKQTEQVITKGNRPPRGAKVSESSSERKLRSSSASK